METENVRVQNLEKDLFGSCLKDIFSDMFGNTKAECYNTKQKRREILSDARPCF